MTAADDIQPSASTASTGKGIRYIGNYCYANSGSITDPGSGSAASTCLDFTSGSGLIMAIVNYGSNSASGSQDEFIEISLNGEAIWDVKYTDAGLATGDQPVNILIPPFTRFVFKWGMTGDTRQLTAILTGRVYGAT